MRRRTTKGNNESAKERATKAIVAYLVGLDQARKRVGESEVSPSWHQPRRYEWTLSLGGSSRQIVNIELTLGEYTLNVLSFFMRRPDRNAEEVHNLLLRRNLELAMVKFGADEFGDLYLRADIPTAAVTEDELDRIIGIFYACTDANYLPVMRLGFLSYIQEQE